MNVHEPNPNGYYGQPGIESQAGKPEPRFFAWIRSSGLVRADDRWIGGVCSGLASRLGWSPTLVRALILVSVLFFGFGAALYAIGWFLMPDCRTGRILAEELIGGEWDWSCLGCLLFLVLAIMIPGAGWLAIALAALTLWIIAKSGIRQSEGYGFGYHGGNVSQLVSHTGQHGMSPSAAARSVNAATFNTAATGVPMYAAPAAAPALRSPAKARRKPAGPIVVMIVLGLSLISFALVMALAWGNDYGMSQLLRIGTIWISAICVLMGLLAIGLGVAKRRAGGLIPLGLFAGFLAVCLTVATGLCSAAYQEFEHVPASVQLVELASDADSENAYGMGAIRTGRFMITDSGAHTFQQLRKGVTVKGDNYEQSKMVIDLSDWKAMNGTHELKLANGETTVSKCPSGTISLQAYQAQVSVILPDGCSYAFSNKYGGYNTGVSVGGKYGALLDSGSWSIGMAYDDPAWDCAKADYDWMNNFDLMPQDGPELMLDVRNVLDAQVRVVYSSDYEGPLFKQYAADHGSANGQSERDEANAKAKAELQAELKRLNGKGDDLADAKRRAEATQQPSPQNTDKEANHD